MNKTKLKKGILWDLFSCLMLLSGCFLVVEICKDKLNVGCVRLNFTYHSIYKMSIDDTDHNLLRVKLISGGPYDTF
jgi:hypothetical protein